MVSPAWPTPRPTSCASFRPAPNIAHATRSFWRRARSTSWCRPPSSIREALVLGGGTDLGLRVSKDREALPVVISTAAVKELQRVRKDRRCARDRRRRHLLRRASPPRQRIFPRLPRSFAASGSRQIRNLGTLAGNLATASPIGDTLPCLMALGAEVTLAWRTSLRTLPVTSFIKGYRETALTPGRGHRGRPHSVSVAPDSALPPTRCPSASTRTSPPSSPPSASPCRTARCASCAPPMAAWRRAWLRAAHIEKAMAGRPWTIGSLADIDALVAEDFTPISDHRGGAAYRLRAAAGLLRRFQIETTLARAGPGGGFMSTPLGRIRGGVHEAVSHDSAVGHVTGQALYLDDVPTVPGTLEAALVLSPHAHARIGRIGFASALAAPGVVAAVTAADIPGKNDIAPIRSDEPLLPAEIAEYEGQPIAAIAAATLDQARAAAKLVKVDYEAVAGGADDRRGRRARALRVAAADHAARRRRRRARERAAPPHRRAALRRPGPFLSRGPDRARRPRRCRRHAGAQLDPASDRGAARRRASARPAVQCRDRRGAAHGRRLRRQGEPGDDDRRHRGAARLEGAAAGEAALAARRRHARDRQAPSVPDPLRRRLRRRGPHPCARSHAGRQRRQCRRPHAGGAHPRALSRRQLLLAAQRPLPRAGVQDQHRLQHGVPRLWRPAGHAGDRDDHRRDRPPARPCRSTRSGGEISTGSAATT